MNIINDYVVSSVLYALVDMLLLFDSHKTLPGEY